MLRQACPTPLRSATLNDLADLVEANPKKLATFQDVDRIDREARVCRGEKAEG